MPCCLLVSLLLVHLADICTTLVRCLDGLDVGLLDDRRSHAGATPAAFPADSRARRRDGFVMLCQGVSDSYGDGTAGVLVRVWFGVCGTGGDAPVRLRCNVCARGRSRHMSDDASPRATRFHAKSSSM